MSRPDIVTLVTREAQTSDTAVYKKDLPKAGGISAIDLGFRITNGSTGGTNLDLLDLLRKVEIVFNGTDRRLSLTGQELYRLHWLKYGRPPEHTWTHRGSAVQEVRLRHMFGRYIGDPLFGVDLSKFNNVQVSVDYDATIWGAAAVGTFTTGTFSPSIMLHMFPPGSVPAFRGMLGAREIWNYTTVGGTLNKDVDLPSTYPVAGIGIFAMEDNIAEATDVTDIIIGKDQYRTRWVDGKWYDLQYICNAKLDVHEESFRLYPTAADNLDTHMANLSQIITQPIQLTPSATVSNAVNAFGTGGATGNRVPIAGTTITVDTDASPTVVGVAMVAGTDTRLTVVGDVHGALYFPFGDLDNLADMLQPADLKSAQVRLVDAAAGAYAAVVVEELYS
jgi:hypothetical protein